ncbi:hypothetical protein [Brucella anthropi]|uniref:hypothetical protein n=1 Tax=Brucella anthropi TaxID=529 RepID=UPI003850830F
MPIMENILARSEACETPKLKDDLLEAEIRAHLRFTQRIGWIMICFLSFLFGAGAFHLIAISF